MARIPKAVRLFAIAGLLSFLAPAHDGFPGDDLERGWYRPPAHFDRVEYVIVTGRDLAESWEPLREWKCAQGVPADVVPVEAVLANPLYRGSDGPETLRNFLKDLYWKWGLEWVLLGGDVNVVPTRFADLIERTACDAYFACLEGTWNEDGDAAFGAANDTVVQQCDLFLGRVPVETPAEVHAFLEKYFRYVKPVKRDYLRRVLCVGAVIQDDFTCDADDHYEYVIEEFLKPAGFEVVHLEQTDFLRGHFEFDPESKKNSGYLFGPENRKAGPAFRRRMIEEVNRGAGVVTHYAHSNTYALGLPKGGLRNADVRQFKNADMPAVFYSGGCHVNQFDNESISEELVLHPGGGAVAFIGCTVNSYSYQNVYERDFWESLLHLGEYRIGRVFEASKIRNSSRITRGGSPVTVLNRGLALLGDPHMPVWTGVPKDMTLKFQSPGAGQKELDIAVLDHEGKPLAGARTSLWRKGEFLESRITDAGGRAMVPLPPRSMEAVRLTVTARHFVPAERDLALVSEGPALVPFEISVEAGGDDLLDAGEEARAMVAVRNDGESAAQGVSGTLISNDPHVKCEQSTLAYGSIEAGGVALPAEGFRFSISKEAPPHHVARFLFRLHSGSDTLWEGILRIRVHTPFLVLSSQIVLLDGKVSPPPLKREHGARNPALELWVANLGTGPAGNVRVGLQCPHEHVSVSPAEQTIERLEPGSRAKTPSPFRLELAPGFDGGPVEFVMTLSPEGAAGREEIFTVREPLEAPKGLRAEAGQASVFLAWTPLSDSRLAGYCVFRAEAEAGPFERVHLNPVTSSCFEDRNLSAQSTYYYQVSALDRDLNPSPRTTAVSVSTTFPPLRDWPKKAKAPLLHVTVCDVDGDGDLEVATGDDKGGIWIWHHTGAELRHGGDNWTFGLFKELPEGAQSPTFADLDGDGKMEVLSSGRFGDRKIYAFNLEAEPLPGFPKTGKGRQMTPPQAADLDGDGNLEIVFHEGFGKHLYVWRRDGLALNYEKKKGRQVPKEIIGETDPFTYFISTLVDLDGNGVLEIVGLGGRGNLYAFRPDGTLVEGFPVKTAGPLGSTAPAGDLDGDGRPEIVFVSNGGTLLQSVGADGKLRKGFPVKLGAFKPSEGQSLPILADVDGKKGLEIVLGGRDGQVFVVDAAGNAVPGFPKKLPQEAFGSAVGDLDGDGKPEIVVGCQDGNVYGFHRDGKPIRGFPLRTGGPVRGALAIADVDGDGDVDVLAGSFDGYLYIWDLAGQYDPGRVAWAMYGADPQRTGAALTPPPPPSGVSVRGKTTARISWRAPRTTRRDRVETFHVWRAEGPVLRRITANPVKGLSHLDRDVVPGKLYRYAVTSVDRYGRESLLTEPFAWGEEEVKAILEKARKHEERRQFKEAIKAYREILQEFPKSRFAPEAKERLEALESDTGVQKDLAKRRAESWCRGMLGLARTWEKSGKPDKAAECYRKIIERHPNTSWAQEAEKRLEALKKK